jgi:hypothetical protein
MDGVENLPQRREVDSFRSNDDDDASTHDENGSIVIVMLFLIVVVGLGYMLLLRLPGASSSSSSSSPQQRDERQQLAASAAAAHTEMTLVNENMHASHLFDPVQWQLPENDRGAFTFTACGPAGGLVVYLSTSPDNTTLSDARGYAIVLDDQGDPPRSYIGELPQFSQPSPRSRVNQGFRLNSARASCQTYWVLYDHGTILVGEGAFSPSSAAASLIVCKDDSASDAPVGVRYFGFGTLRRETEGITVSRIATYDAPSAEMRLRAPPQCSAESIATMVA